MFQHRLLGIHKTLFVGFSETGNPNKSPCRHPTLIHHNPQVRVRSWRNLCAITAGNAKRVLARFLPSRERSLTGISTACLGSQTNSSRFISPQNNRMRSRTPHLLTRYRVRARFCVTTGRVAGYTCTIYPTRPRQCRDFRCYHMIIRTAGGEICGRVKGRSDLITADEKLAKLWKEEVEPIPRENPAAWVRAVTSLLAQTGIVGNRSNNARKRTGSVQHMYTGFFVFVRTRYDPYRVKKWT